MTARSDTLELRTLAEPGELAELAEAWDELALAMPRPSPFMSTPWLLPWWKHHGTSRTMVVETAFSGGRLVGGLPLEIEKTRLGLRVAHVMGRHHAALGGVVMSDDAPDNVTASLLGRLGQHGVDYVDFFGLSAESPIMPLATTRAATFERVASPRLDLTRGWEETYRALTSSKRRNLHSRRRRQLDELGGLDLAIAASELEVAAALDDAFRLHDLRWTGRNDGSEFTTPIGREFNADAAGSLARAGIARILTLRVAGKPVAFHYYLVFANRMYVYRLAFDPEISKYSPGLTATLAAIEAAAAEGVVAVEYCGGGERYKLELSDGPAPMFQCVGFPQTLSGRVGARGARTVLSVGLWAKKSPRLRAAYLTTAARVRGQVHSPPGD